MRNRRLTEKQKKTLAQNYTEKKVEEFKPIVKSLLYNANVLRRKGLSHIRTERELHNELKKINDDKKYLK